jgi:hypothetical protein
MKLSSACWVIRILSLGHAGNLVYLNIYVVAQILLLSEVQIVLILYPLKRLFHVSWLHLFVCVAVHYGSKFWIAG